MALASVIRASDVKKIRGEIYGFKYGSPFALHYNVIFSKVCTLKKANLT